MIRYFQYSPLTKKLDFISDEMEMTTISEENLPVEHIDAILALYEKLKPNHEQQIDALREDNTHLGYALERAKEENEKIRSIAFSNITEEEEEDYVSVYPDYEVGVKYYRGEMIRFGDTLYQLKEDYKSKKKDDPQSMPEIYEPYSLKR